MSSAYFMLRIVNRKRLKKSLKSATQVTETKIHEDYSKESASKRSDPQSPICTIQNKCRVCLKQGNTSIYSTKNSFDISEAIQKFADIEINRNDAFPKFLCQSCYSILQSAVIFRELAKSSDAFLRLETSPDTVEMDMVGGDQSDNTENYESLQGYNCNICKLKFNSLNEYAIHKNSKIHKNIRVQCPICQGILTSQFYKKHLARHQSTTHLICEVCGKLYRKDNLLRHLQLHSYKLPYQCQVCPYRGRFVESVKIHMRTHTGDKPFFCDKCKLRFLTRSNLNRHLLIHNKEKPYKCVECGRGFYSKRDMDVHFKTDHTGIKDFLCKLCENKYGTRKALMRHELRVHKRTKLTKGRIPLYLQVEYRKSGNTP